MTIYARNDLAYVHLSDAHGGCGQAHRRPVEHGAPVKQWQLTCAQCEVFLSKDDQWATSLADLPETPDEAKGREDFQKRGATDRDNVLALAMAKLAGVELPQTIRQAISGASPALPAIAGKMVCEAGHDADPGSKFCAECGRPMRRPAVAACPNGHQVGAEAKFCAECGSGVSPAAAVTPAIEPPAPRAAAPRSTGPRVKPLKDWRLEDLRAEAQRRGLDDSGTRVEVLERIRRAQKVPQAA
jgi:hypothetical protein